MKHGLMGTYELDLDYRSEKAPREGMFEMRSI